MKKNNIYFQKRLVQPANYFEQPNCVLENSKLESPQKIKVLLAWRFDIEELDPNTTGINTLERLDQVFEIDATITQVIHSEHILYSTTLGNVFACSIQ